MNEKTTIKIMAALIYSGYMAAPSEEFVSGFDFDSAAIETAIRISKRVDDEVAAGE